MRFDFTTYVKTLLGAVASLFLAILFPTFALLRGISSEKATGLAAVAGGLMEGGFSPWFWIFYVLFFTTLYLTGNLASKFLRIILFWIPTLLICLAGLSLWTLFVYLARHYPARP